MVLAAEPTEAETLATVVRRACRGMPAEYTGAPVTQGMAVRRAWGVLSVAATGQVHPALAVVRPRFVPRPEVDLSQVPLGRVHRYRVAVSHQLLLLADFHQTNSATHSPKE